MKYIQLYNKDLSGKVVEAMGSFSVLVVDGRVNLDNIINLGFELLEKENKISRGYYVGFKVHQGESFSRSKPITRLIEGL